MIFQDHFEDRKDDKRIYAVGLTGNDHIGIIKIDD